VAEIFKIYQDETGNKPRDMDIHNAPKIFMGLVESTTKGRGNSHYDSQGKSSKRNACRYI